MSRSAMRPSVAVGLSGGVDSALTACLLQESGFQVIGVYLQLGEENTASLADAAKIANQLKIELRVADGRTLFREQIIERFINDYAAGRTPNPCTLCNTAVKWALLLREMESIGAANVATGHYAQVLDCNTRRSIRMSPGGKDQSYVLYQLTQEQLSKTLFPLGHFAKEAVRGMAKERGLSVADKPDSQEICFIQKGRYTEFLRESGLCDKGFVPGDFVDEHGRKLGTHQGIACYTIGQRKGLGISADQPLFVKALNAAENTVMLSSDTALYTQALTITEVCYMALPETARPNKPMRALGKIRYAHRPAPCSLTWEGTKLHCLFDENQRAVTPGQAAVFYDENFTLLCGGVIA